jgi:hypothetical protein
MRPSLAFATVALGLYGFAMLDQGSGQETYEGLVKEMLTTVEQLTTTLKTIKDRPSAEAARPELKKSAEKMLQLHKKAEEWKQPNKEQLDKLKKEYSPKLEVAVKQLNELAVAVKSIPGGEEAVTELDILKEKTDKSKAKKVGK